MNTVKDVRDWLQKLAQAQVEGVWSVRPMLRIGREDLLRAIEVLEPFKDLPDAPNPGLDDVTPTALELVHQSVRAEMWNAVMLDLVKERDAFGMAKYGQGLRTHDGRDTHKEIRDEVGDAVQYIAKGVMERKMTREQWAEVYNLTNCLHRVSQRAFYKTAKEDDQ